MPNRGFRPLCDVLHTLTTDVLTSTLRLAPFVNPATATEVAQGDDSHEYQYQTPDNQSSRQGNATNNPPAVISDLIFYQGIRTLPAGTLTFSSRIPVRSIPHGTLTFDPWNSSLGTMSTGCPAGDACACVCAYFRACLHVL